VRSLLCNLVRLYSLAIILRIILSWFPLKSGGVVARIADFLVTITEPILGPLRRILPRTGVIDLSPLIALLLLQIVVAGFVLGCGAV
jgi:YggT family protein